MALCGRQVLVSMVTKMRTSLLLCNSNFAVANYISKKETSCPCLENVNHFDTEQQPRYPTEVQEEEPCHEQLWIHDTLKRKINEI